MRGGAGQHRDGGVRGSAEGVQRGGGGAGGEGELRGGAGHDRVRERRAVPLRSESRVDC